MLFIVKGVRSNSYATILLKETPVGAFDKCPNPGGLLAGMGSRERSSSQSLLTESLQPRFPLLGINHWWVDADIAISLPRQKHFDTMAHILLRATTTRLLSLSQGGQNSCCIVPLKEILLLCIKAPQNVWGQYFQTPIWSLAQNLTLYQVSCPSKVVWPRLQSLKADLMIPF